MASRRSGVAFDPKLMDRKSPKKIKETTLFVNKIILGQELSKKCKTVSRQIHILGRRRLHTCTTSSTHSDVKHRRSTHNSSENISTPQKPEERIQAPIPQLNMTFGSLFLGFPVACWRRMIPRLEAEVADLKAELESITQQSERKTILQLKV